MRRFLDLISQLETTTSTRRKVEAMRRYFESVDPMDGAWAVFLLSGERLKRVVSSAALRRWIVEASGLPPWLVEESYAAVGDLAETTALLAQGLPGLAGGGSTAQSLERDDATLFAPPRREELPSPADSLASWMGAIESLRGLNESTQRRVVFDLWRGLEVEELFLVTKLITGAFRVGVGATLLQRALALVTGLPATEVTQRLTGRWTPTAAAYRRLMAPQVPGAQGGTGGPESSGQPLPFFLASPLEDPAESLGPIGDWLLEWKWDGIRAQLLRDARGVALWSRGEELITERVPEVTKAGLALPPGTILDGELIAWRDGRPLGFHVLQTRIGRQRLTPRVLAEAPLRFLAYDLLVVEGDDLRERPLRERRARLEALLEPAAASGDIQPGGRLLLSPRLVPADWAEAAALRSESRARGVEGLMLKALDSGYGAGRRRGAWWKWKLDPFSVDAVLLYAQPGHGRRAGLLTDYTFGLWQDGQLQPFAKAYSGLDNREIAELDRWIRAHTIERFGPVRSVEPVQVFEIGFEAVQRSTRHRCGWAVRFPRILRWRRDKQAEEADGLGALERLQGG